MQPRAPVYSGLRAKLGRTCSYMYGGIYFYYQCASPPPPPKKKKKKKKKTRLMPPPHEKQCPSVLPHWKKS